MYTIKLLDSPIASTGPFSQAFAINSHGQVAGVATDTLNFRAVLWNSSPVQLPLIGRSSIATGINDSGDVVGFWGQDIMPGQAFLYRGGSLQDLSGVFKTQESRASDINAAGLITVSAGAIGQNHGFIYHSKTGGAPVDLGALPGHSQSGAQAINNQGHVTGISESSQGQRHAYLYNGAMTDLGTAVNANDLNKSGQVVGSRVFDLAGRSTAFLCETSSGTPQFKDLGPLPLPGFVGSEASGINNQGDIVGHSFSDYGGGQMIRAFVRPAGGAMQDLNTLIPQNSGWLLHWAAEINDRGQIVGAGSYNGSYRAYLLTPALGGYKPDQYILFVTILVGLIGGGSGVVFVPGTGPVPVDPEPLRLWARLPPEKKDMLIGMAMSELASLANDEKSRQELERDAMAMIRRAVDQLASANRIA